MRMIKPSEISARILTLLDESDERVIIVSPYMKISKWYKLIKKVKGLKSRKVIAEIYVRDDPENQVTYSDLDRLDLEYHKIPNLHCKLYMNEKYGIVTSMNLLLNSEINSLEIGYLTETQSEYNDLIGFCQRYIRTGGSSLWKAKAGPTDADLLCFISTLMEEIERSRKNVWLYLSDQILHICTGENEYEVYFKGGYLRVYAKLKTAACMNPNSNNLCNVDPESNDVEKLQDIQASFLIVQKIESLSGMIIEMLPGTEPDNLLLLGQTKHVLESTWETGVLEDEAAFLIESVSKFIDTADQLIT